MKRALIITMIMVVALIQTGAATIDLTTDPGTISDWTNDVVIPLQEMPPGSTVCDLLDLSSCADCTDEVKFEEFFDGDLSVGDTTSDSGITITITEVKVNGDVDAVAFDWTSESDVCAVIVKADGGANVYLPDGAQEGSGVTYDYDDQKYGISHITFCYSCDENGGGGPGGDPDDPAIPEFPTIALPVAAIIGLAFLMQRRKE